jgi:hypothetical protein
MLPEMVHQIVLQEYGGDPADASGNRLFIPTGLQLAQFKMKFA